jgi:hypothetical protein
MSKRHRCAAADKLPSVADTLTATTKAGELGNVLAQIQTGTKEKSRLARLEARLR